MSYFVENIHQCQCFKYDNIAKHKPWLQHAFLLSHIILGASNSISFMVLFILDSVCLQSFSFSILLSTNYCFPPFHVWHTHFSLRLQKRIFMLMLVCPWNCIWGCQYLKDLFLNYIVASGFWGGLVPENAFNASSLEALLSAGVLGLKVILWENVSHF